MENKNNEIEIFNFNTLIIAITVMFIMFKIIFAFESNISLLYIIPLNVIIYPFIITFNIIILYNKLFNINNESYTIKSGKLVCNLIVLSLISTICLIPLEIIAIIKSNIHIKIWVTVALILSIYNVLSPQFNRYKYTSFMKYNEYIKSLYGGEE